MKSLLLSFILITLAGCSHHQHKQEMDTGHHQEHIDRKVEHKKIKLTHQKAIALFGWFSEHLKEHEDEINEHRDEFKKHERELARAGSSLQAKKIKLEKSRKHTEMAQEHEHFLEDHNKFLEILRQLEELKKELELHEEHHH